MNEGFPVSCGMLLLSLFILFSSVSSEAEPPLKPCPAFNWESIPFNKWVRLPGCGQAPRKVFHGASALAEDRNQVFFFGADTHDNDYDNSVYRLDLPTLKWSKDYEADPIEEYLLTREGYAVTTSGRPWAMHTFDALDYVPEIQSLICTSSPRHAHKALERLSHQSGRDLFESGVTWQYHLDSREWQLIKTQSPNLFARGQVWDPVGHQLIGHNGESTFHYDPHHRQWTPYLEPSVPGWHRKLVFDTYAGKVLSLGHNGGSSDLWSYSPKSIVWKKITTHIQPLPADGATMAYDIHQSILLYLANDSPNQYSNPSGKSATFIYSSENQTWTRLSIQSPPLYGMNYLMQYDPSHRVFLHFERAPDSQGKITIWAFSI